MCWRQSWPASAPAHEAPDSGKLDVVIVDLQSLAEAQQLMLDDHIRRLTVLKDGKLVGIVTWREINHAESAVSSSLGPYEMNLMRARLTANEFMSTPVVTISLGATIGEAAGLMMEHKISSLPVVENGKLVGLITEAHIDAYSFHDRELSLA